MYHSRKPEKTSMDDDIPDLCSLSKKPLEGLTAAERMVRCTREIADGSFLVRSEKTLKPDSETFNNALKAFDTHFRLLFDIIYIRLPIVQFTCIQNCVFH